MRRLPNVTVLFTPATVTFPTFRLTVPVPEISIALPKFVAASLRALNSEYVPVVAAAVKLPIEPAVSTILPVPAALKFAPAPRTSSFADWPSAIVPANVEAVVVLRRRNAAPVFGVGLFAPAVTASVAGVVPCSTPVRIISLFAAGFRRS